MSCNQLNAGQMSDYEVGFICSAKFEYDAVIAMLDINYGPPCFPPKVDTNLYCLGKIGVYKVVVATPPPDASSRQPVTDVATNMNHTFTRMKHRFMVGVGGGAPTKGHEIHLGDVVVGVRGDYPAIIRYDYHQIMNGVADSDTRKWQQQIPKHASDNLLSAVNGTRDRHERKGHHLNAMIDKVLDKDPALKQRFERPSSTPDLLSKATAAHTTRLCQDSWTGNSHNVEARKPPTTEDRGLNIHYGTIMSSENMMSDAELRDRIAEVMPHALCFDKESEGIGNMFGVLFIRGICHYSDTHDYEAWNNYAAIAAAAFAKDLLVHGKNHMRSWADVKAGTVIFDEDFPSVMYEVVLPKHKTRARPRTKSRLSSLGRAIWQFIVRYDFCEFI